MFDFVNKNPVIENYILKYLNRSPNIPQLLESPALIALFMKLI